MTAALALRQTVALSQRSLVGRLRQPAALAPAFVFPLFFAALGASSFDTLGDRLPGGSYLQFVVAGSITQGVLFGSTSAASDLATDIQGGFWERMIASPVHRTSIILGRLMSALVIGMGQVLVFLAIFTAFGVRVRSGPIGWLGLVVGGGLMALAIAGAMSTFAIRTGSAEAVQGAFPLVFILMFLSSAFFPRELMSGWYQSVADLNPLSYVIEGLRSFVNEPLQADAFLRAWGIPLIFVALAVALCLSALRARLRMR